VPVLCRLGLVEGLAAVVHRYWKSAGAVKKDKVADIRYDRGLSKYKLLWTIGVAAAEFRGSSNLSDSGSLATRIGRIGTSLANETYRLCVSR